ncbi:MAG: hypothetical protein ABR520_02040 [Mycobacteriales bacterium]|nr:hypothetical protein [Frankia sp.]
MGHRARATFACAALLIGVLAGIEVGTPPALAHQRASLRFRAPTDGEQVIGTRVSVVVEAYRTGAAGAPAEFRLTLDGQSVDTSGRVGGGIFTSFQLAAGATTRLTLPLARPGTHELRASYATEAHDSKSDVVRRFVSTLPSPTASPASAPGGRRSGGHWPERLIGVALGAAGYLLVRRRRRARAAVRDAPSP